MMTDSEKELVNKLRVGPVGCLTCDDAAAAIERLSAQVASLKETIRTAITFNEGLARERDEARAEAARLKAAVTKFISEADMAPKRIIGNGIGGQTMEASLKREGRLVSEWQLGQLEEALEAKHD